MTGCACGHHHHAPARIEGGEGIALDRPLVALSGTLTCQDAAQMMLALDLLPQHVSLSRAEPGNLRFDLSQQDDPMVWRLDELFADAEAFAAHQARTAASPWGTESCAILRDFTRTEVMPRIRPEHPQDRTAIAALLELAFDGGAESRLVSELRAAGDLALSLVADVQGSIVGHVALSPLAAEGPALALAPLAVHPAVQARGIGTALVRAALAGWRITRSWFWAIGLLRAPGLQPVEVQSPYAGPHLLAAGPALPRGSAIAHAPAFAAL
ncbi:GNAT family N-acetyltransferase [Paracoccus mutanolyticus]|uniref:GNAT family N-acetyltransferase n=1 Tax=Paracoccus mutanolyticus TaxID=1499308 RepID=A0ABN5M7N1_9RHOB|nr:GNAT family N-acetyltransferase [Paracoccus mutanolyticus]AWX94038.1 GNAT family N-acetyltransferase [Paracoccus mutanolyticus]